MLVDVKPLKGRLSNTSPIKGRLNRDVEILAPATQEKNITPSRSQQSVIPDDGYTGLSKVTVDPIPDEYVIPSGVVEITKNGQVDVTNYKTANVGFDTSDATAESGDIASGKTAYTKDGLIEGTGVLEKPITKGFRIDSFDENGYATEVTLVGFTSIPNYYFYYAGYQSGSWGAKNGLKINLQDGITSLGQSAFYYCVGLTSIKFSNTLTSIGKYCFDGCKNITKLEFPSSMVNLPTSAFGSCHGIKEVICYGDVKVIGNYCFENCSGISKFVMPYITKVPTIYNSSFISSSQIAKGNGYIYVPDNLVEEMKATTNWSTYADQIRGMSEMV